MLVKNSPIKNTFFVVTNAVNEKNGANGSMIDLIIALKKTSNVSIFTLVRPPIIGLFESLINIGITSYSKFSLSIYQHILNKPEVIFFIGSSSKKQILSFKKIYPNAKLVIFQTGDIKNNKIELDKIIIVDYVLFQSPGQKLDFQDIYNTYQNKALLLRPTIKEDKFINCNNNLFDINLINKSKLIKFVIIGSIQERKNQLDAIKFCKILKEKYNFNLKLYVVGPFVDKDYKNIILNFIDKNQLTDLIIFTGFKKKYTKYLCQSHIVLSFSKEEGLSTIIRESLYLGKLIVASNIPGNTGTLNKENSILFDLNNNTETLVDNIFPILFDKNKTYKIMNNAKKTYSTRHSIKKYSEALSEIVCNIK